MAQRAIKTGNALYCCRLAEKMNNDEGRYSPEDASAMYTKLSNFSKHFNLWDVLNNRDNCGVIFDYAKGYYKAVCIDYAL